MPTYLGQSKNFVATLALMLAVLAIMLVFAMQSTPCAQAASGSCSVGDLETFTSAITVNEDGNDADTRIEGDTEPNLTYWDAGNNAVLIGHAAPINSETLGVTGDFYTGGDQWITDGNGLIIGNLSQVTVSSFVQEFQVLGTGGIDSSALLGRWSADSGAGNMLFAKSRNAVIGSSTIVQDNDQVGNIAWFADDGADLNTQLAQIQGNVDDGTPAANAIGGELVFRTSTTGGTATTSFTIDSSQDLIVNDKDIYPDTDGAGSLGIQTTNQWGNVWSDLINGADYGYENGWRMLEADTYAGYGPGIAIDYGEHFEVGKALAIRRVDNGKTKQVEVGADSSGNPIFETHPVLDRERVTNVPLTPVFAVTNEFIEFHGIRITVEDWTALAALAAAN